MKVAMLIWLQQFLSIPVYTIFKNLTIILIVRTTLVELICLIDRVFYIGIWGGSLVRWPSYSTYFSILPIHGERCL